MKTAPRKAVGFTLIEIMFVVAVFGILVLIAIPIFMKARHASERNSCIANLKQLDSAITVWAMEARKSVGSAIDSSAFIGGTNYLRQMPKCGGGGTYSFATVGAIPQASCSLADQGHALP